MFMLTLKTATLFNCNFSDQSSLIKSMSKFQKNPNDNFGLLPLFLKLAGFILHFTS